MHSGQPDRQLLSTINSIEQTLRRLRPANDREVRLRLCIEEAVEVGYEVVYRRLRKNGGAQVLAFRPSGGPMQN
jgi:hypothetical protein